MVRDIVLFQMQVTGAERKMTHCNWHLRPGLQLIRCSLNFNNKPDENTVFSFGFCVVLRLRNYRDTSWTSLTVFFAKCYTEIESKWERTIRDVYWRWHESNHDLGWEGTIYGTLYDAYWRSDALSLLQRWTGLERSNNSTKLYFKTNRLEIENEFSKIWQGVVVIVYLWLFENNSKKGKHQ